MTDIYDQHDKAFSQTSAYVIALDGERVATIALRFPHDGAGRLWAYVHWLGTPMVRGYASGYGYDKRTAAIANAVGRMPDVDMPARGEYEAFITALSHDAGPTWDNALRDAGFTVWQAV